MAALVLALAGCATNECGTPVASWVRDGSASLHGSVLGQVGTARRDRHIVRCASVLFVRSTDYADTLAYGHLDLGESGFTFTGLDTGRVDIIFDRNGYFAIKVSDLALSSGKNSLGDRLLMFRADTPIALPGEFGFTLKRSSSEEDVTNAAWIEPGLRLFPEPGSYRVVVPFRGTNRTRHRVEMLVRRFAHSPHVADVRPYTSMTSVEHGL